MDLFPIGNIEIILSFIFLHKTFTMGNKLQLYLEIDESEIEELHRKIAFNVKRRRLEKNISQMELALTIGHRSVSTIGKIEAGLENKHYNIETLYKISKVLNINICEFFR